MNYQFAEDCIRFFPDDHSGLIIYSNLSGDTHFLRLDGIAAKKLFDSAEPFNRQQIDALTTSKDQPQQLFQQLLEKKIITEVHSQ